ncbi:MAG TPA: metalloregulator ArsR/SmtB family transcription factor, partial [Polyangium sp.]|nr:metalloregulator ArsR/SmtB family transcription factor [Polyangium sp.]
MQDASGSSGRFSTDATQRWELYRLLADPVRPRLLALAAAEELGVGELTELLHEAQSKISRHASALRDAGLLSARKQGTWTLLRLTPGVMADPVVADAVRSGTAACSSDGTLARIAEVIATRDATTREFFARGGRPLRPGPAPEFGAYLAAIAPLLPHRALAVDVGTGDGSLLELLSPIFDVVVGIDRSEAQVSLAEERIRRRELSNVELVLGEYDGPEVLRTITDRGGADVVVAARVLHHAPKPVRAMQALYNLAKPRGGAVCVIDYEAHEDLALCEQEADLWQGFEPDTLRSLAETTGLSGIT